MPPGSQTLSRNQYAPILMGRTKYAVVSAGSKWKGRGSAREVPVSVSVSEDAQELDRIQLSVGEKRRE